LTSELIHRRPLTRVRTRRADADETNIPVHSLVDALSMRAEEAPDDIAFDFEDGTLTYAQLLADATELSRNLFVRGIDRGGRCALVLDTGVELARFIVAVQMLGAAPVVINPDLRAPSILRRLRDVRVEIAVVGERLLATLRPENDRVHSRIRLRTPDDIRADVASGRTSDVNPSREDLVAIVPSAGSDGEVHGVTLRHRNVIAWADAAASHFDLSRDDVLASHLPLFIGMDLAWFVFLPLVVGCKSVHRPFPSRAPERWLRSVAEHKPTIMVGNDSFLRVLATARFWETIEIESLRTVISYGEPSRRKTIEDFEARFNLGRVVRPAYGLLETIGAVTAPLDDTLKFDRNGVAACGVSLPGYAVRVVDGEGRECAPGKVGEVVVAGEGLLQSYFDEPDLTAERLRDGQFRTGDLGYFDGQGDLFVFGRDSEIIRLATRSLLPRQVEEAAGEVLNIEAVAAIGRPAASDDPDDAETLVVVAEVSRLAREERDQMRTISDAVSTAVKDALQVAPDEVLLVKPGVLPRTADGRLRYAQLREQIIGGSLAREGAILHGGNVFISPLSR
jgi:long-chain acyl-CoA synthetase